MPPMEATVGEIHAYPLRSEGYAEPLFHSARSRREILEHFAKSSWLGRASELSGGRHCVEYSGKWKGERVLASWREVDRWWEPGGGVDVVWRLVESERGKQEVLQEPVRTEPARAA